MMNISKIHLSSSELELMQNAEIILTKNKILEKVREMLGGIQEQQTALVKQLSLKDEIFTVPPKISRGENYMGLPYLILDYPRQSSAGRFFFIRSMFWWGRFFSCTLHLAGEAKDLYKENIRQSVRELKNNFIGVTDDQWIHHLEDTHYKRIGSLTKTEFEQYCDQFSHLKIAAKFSLSEWTGAPSNLFECWMFYLRTCGLIS